MYMKIPICASPSPGRRHFSLSLVLLFASLCIGANLSAQRTVVIGTVTDETGTSLPGVTIMVEGTTSGSTTDLDGNYQITTTSDGQLTFSYLGYQRQTLEVNGRSRIDVTMSEAISQLDEVVVTGYATIKRSDLVTAHTSLDAEDLERTVNPTLEQALQGRAAGVQVTQNTGQPGGGISVNIRGISTINGNTQPLYVVDGVQIQVDQIQLGAQSAANPLAGINPSDIASIEVLTGPVAASLYGSRATNGVVVITTKSGQAGRTNIKYDFAFSQQARPEYLDVMDLSEYAAMAKEYVAIEGGTLPGEFEDPSLLGAGTNWQEELFNDASMFKHNLSVSGGNDKTTYYISGEVFDQEGVAVGSGFQRYSGLVKVDNQLTDRLKLSSKVNLSQTETRLITGQENIVSTALQMTSNIPVRDFDGTFGGGDTETSASQQFLPPNPIGLAEITTNNLMKRQALLGLNASYDLGRGLTLSAAVNADISNSEARYFQPQYKFGFQERTTATLAERSQSSTYWNFQQILSYYKQFGTRHTLNVMGVHEAQRSNWRNLAGGISDFVSEEVIDLNLGNTETATVDGGRGSWAQESWLGRLNYNFAERYYVMATARADGSSNFGANNKWGIFPSASLAWRISNEPFFTIGAISELRLRFETGLTGNQGGGGFIYGTLGAWTTPWGTGFALNRYANPNLQWEATQTNNFGLDLAFLEDRIQLEFDYYTRNTDELLTEAANPDYLGVTGSGSIANPFVNAGSLRNEGWTVRLQTRNINTPNFTWSTDFNFSVVDSKILSLNTSSGFFDRTSWWMDNWTQRSAIGQAPWLFYGFEADGLYESLEDINNSPLPVDNDGNPLPVSPDGIWVGDVKYRDISGPDGEPDGVIDSYDQTYIGNPNARQSLGLTNTFTYKSVDLSVLFTGSFNYDVYNYTAYAATNPNNINLSRNLLNRAYDFARVALDAEEQPYIVNAGTDVPRINATDLNGNYSRHSSRFVEDGSFLRLKNVTLAYNLPAATVSRLGFIQSLRVAVSAQNLATFTNYTGYDPEIGAYVGRNSDAGNQAVGVDNGRYPSVPLYTVSVGVQF